MRPGNLVPSFYFYKFSEALSGPYTALSAYSSGIIDSSGNILKPESSIDPFEYLIIKLKKIIEQLPYGMTKSQLGNYLSTIRMFSEELEKYEITKDQFDCMMEGFIMLKTDNQLSYLELLEDMSVGAGGGAAGSLGTPMGNSNSPTVAGFDPVMNMPMGRRKPAPKYFDNCEVFEIDPEEFMQFRVAKGWNEIPKGKNSEYIRRFQLRNKGKKIAVKSLNPLNGEHELQWIEYPSPNFMGEGLNPELFDFLFEDVKTSKLGNHAGEVISKLIEKLGVKDNYEISNLSAFDTEYVGRMIDWVNGFHAASLSGHEGHPEQWIDLGYDNASKQASTNDSVGPEKKPDGFIYDTSVKSENFQDRILPVDYGTDRKPVGEISRKRKGIDLGGKEIDLPKSGSAFKTKVRELISDPSIEQQMRDQIQSQTVEPQGILHKRTTGRPLDPEKRGFVRHGVEELQQLVQSDVFNLSPTVGKPTDNEPFGRQAIKTTDLRVRTTPSPSEEDNIGYDAIRVVSGTDEPKEALSVSTEALDHLFDNIPDNYVGFDNMNKDALRDHVQRILLPHSKTGRYPLRIPSSKVIST